MAAKEAIGAVPRVPGKTLLWTPAASECFADSCGGKEAITARGLMISSQRLYPFDLSAGLVTLADESEEGCRLLVGHA